MQLFNIPENIKELTDYAETRSNLNETIGIMMTLNYFLEVYNKDQQINYILTQTEHLENITDKLIVTIKLLENTELNEKEYIEVLMLLLVKHNN